MSDTATIQSPSEILFKRIVIAMLDQERQRKVSIAKRWRTSHQEQYRATRRAHYQKHRRKFLEEKRVLYIKRRGALGLTVVPPRDPSTVTPEQRLQARRESRARFMARYPERIKAAQKKWQTTNREKMLEGAARRYRDNPQTNIASKIRKAIRRGIVSYGDGKKCKEKSTELLGCTFAELQIYIEARFSKGMTWKMVLSGEVHLDHKRPIASFDLTDEQQRRECFHFTNLQPLWALDNMRKHSKYTPEVAR